jgi:sec-independent protein translocase protein TatA
MPNIGPVELIIILVIALLILGPGKLPDVGAALGKSIREFRKAATDVQDAVKVDATPEAPTPSPTPPPTPNALAAPAEPNTLVTPAAPAQSAPAEPVATTSEPKA